MFRLSTLLLAAVVPASAVVCQDGADCAESEYCRDNVDGSDYVCTAKGSAGVSCSSFYLPWGGDQTVDDMCADGLDCYESACTAPVGVGENCAAASCTSGNYCDNFNICSAQIAVGGVCTGTTSDYDGCVDTAYCTGLTESFGPFECAALLGEGDACTNDVQCGTTEDGTDLSCDTLDTGKCYDPWGEFADALGGAVAAAAAIGTTIIIVAVVGGIVGCLCCVAVIYFVCIKK